MKKLVIKTASITLAVIIGVMALTFGALCIFAPKTVAGLFDGAGGYSASVFFYEKQYNKTQSTDDLYYLVLKLDDQKDPTKTREYLSVFLALEGVEDYCKTFDTTNNKMTTYEYLNGKYACAIYKDTGIGDTITFLEKSVADGYTDYNAYSTIISVYGEVLTTEELNALKSSIQGLTRTNQYVTRDINLINELLK